MFERLYPQIPPELHSFETGEPFTTCIECSLPLIDEREPLYTITKAVQRSEVLVEWAICQDCSSRLKENLSDESKEAMQRFIQDARTPRNHVLNSAEKKMSYCFLCARDRSLLDGYTIQAICSGTELINLQAPLLVCHDCEEKASDLLSKKTRDHYDRFFDQHFAGPPGSAVPYDLKKIIAI
ncbi:MAG: hypothetical protein AAGJ31_06475 [Verrucomicrobiota bacterium]